MTDEGMRLLPCPFCGGEGVLTRYTHSFPYEIRCKHCGASSARLRSQRGASEVWNRRSSHPEPQGEMPEPDVIQQAREAGDMAGTAVIKMLRAYDALASRLREADGQVAFWKERSMSADAEMNLYKGRAEAAERGEGMVMVSRSQIEEVIGMAQRFKDIGRRSPHKARMSILEAKLTGWLSAAEEKK